MNKVALSETIGLTDAVAETHVNKVALSESISFTDSISETHVNKVALSEINIIDRFDI